MAKVFIVSVNYTHGAQVKETYEQVKKLAEKSRFIELTLDDGVTPISYNVDNILSIEPGRSDQPAEPVQTTFEPEGLGDAVIAEQAEIAPVAAPTIPSGAQATSLPTIENKK